MSLLAISNDEYHARPGVSASMLKSMASGWRAFQAEYVTKTSPRKESAAMALGTAVHAALLEPELFADEYAVIPEECSDRRTKAYKEWAASNGDRKTLSPSDAATIEQIKSAAWSDDIAEMLLRGSAGTNEGFFEWTEGPRETLCRVRFDRLAEPFIIDIKTTDDARPEAFAATVAKYRYDLQAAHYLTGLEGFTRSDLRFVFIAVETSSPYRCRCYELSESDLAAAHNQRRSLLAEYEERLAKNDWSEPGESELRTVFLPNWFTRKVDNE
jgi:hypothetical protein